jgi:hypothetical protein
MGYLISETTKEEREQIVKDDDMPGRNGCGFAR